MEEASKVNMWKCFCQVVKWWASHFLSRKLAHSVRFRHLPHKTATYCQEISAAFQSALLLWQEYFCVCLHYFSLLQHLLVSWFTDCVSTTHIPNLVKCFRRHRPYHPSPSTTFSPLIGRRAVQSTKLTLEELVMDCPDSAFLLISWNFK